MTTAARLAFFGFAEPETPPSSPARSRDDAARAAVDAASRPRPEVVHVVHWRFITRGNEQLRLTSAGGELCLGPWLRNARGEWWPMKGARVLRIDDREAPAFAAAVAKAAEAVAGRGRQP